MSLNRAAHIALGSPTAVELLHDRQKHIVGLRWIDLHAGQPTMCAPAATVSADHSSSPRWPSRTSTTSTRSISRRWTAYVEDEVLCVDLKGPAVEIVSNRSSQRLFLHTHEADDEQQFGQA